jgi:hypothetical protein
MTRHFILALALVAAPVLGGCGSNTTESLDSGTSDTAGITPFGLTGGDSCFTITDIAPGFSDGCALGVDKLVYQSLPMNYDGTTAIATLGTQGSLGGGAISNNLGTLVRDNYPIIDGTTCTYHQTDNTQLQMTADNAFTVTVTETQSTFGATCAAADVPVGGTCTSTWKWTMAKSTVPTLLPPACGSTP